jgi:hypothetical protein
MALLFYLLAIMIRQRRIILLLKLGTKNYELSKVSTTFLKWKQDIAADVCRVLQYLSR